jgi:hypothetical protein
VPPEKEPPQAAVSKSPKPRSFLSAMPLP